MYFVFICVKFANAKERKEGLCNNKLYRCLFGNRQKHFYLQNCNTETAFFTDIYLNLLFKLIF